MGFKKTKQNKTKKTKKYSICIEIYKEAEVLEQRDYFLHFIILIMRKNPMINNNNNKTPLN